MSSHVDRIRPDSYGITTYLENLRRGKYQIPTFQREVVWERDRVKRLWDSIYKFYPLGSILVWRTEIRLQNHREIGGHPLDDGLSGRDFQYLLDGQQRTTALLTSVYGGRIKGQESRDPHLYVDLTIDDIDEVEDEAWRKRFLFWDEIDDRDGQLIRNIGRKQGYDAGIIVKIEDISHKYSALERRLFDSGRVDFDDPARKQLRSFKQIFDNYKLSFIELRGIEVAEVCQIFERINQAGQPLSMFDIVVAKTFRPEDNEVPGFYLRGLFENFRDTLNTDGSRFAAVDDMTLLQVLAVIVAGQCGGIWSAQHYRPLPQRTPDRTLGGGLGRWNESHPKGLRLPGQSPSPARSSIGPVSLFLYDTCVVFFPKPRSRLPAAHALLLVLQLPQRRSSEQHHPPAGPSAAAP